MSYAQAQALRVRNFELEREVAALREENEGLREEVQSLTSDLVLTEEINKRLAEALDDDREESRADIAGR